MWNYGVFGTYLIKEQLKAYMGDDLPDIPIGYTLPVINSDRDIECAFKMIRSYAEKIIDPNENIISFGKSDYEDSCFLTTLLFSPIFDYWFGWCDAKYKDDYDITNLYILSVSSFWDYLDNEISINVLKKNCEDFMFSYISKGVS